MRPLAAMLPLLASFALAQSEPDPGHSRHGAEFDEGPRTAAWLMPGMSDQVHFAVAGLGAEAQRFFDQGVCQQHGFWYFEAERSFRQVAMLQPDCAMAYWGMVMANVENPARAAGFAAEAVRRREAAGHREQLWIDAYARFYGIGDERRAALQSDDPAAFAKAKGELAAAAKDRAEPATQDAHRRLIKDLGTIVHEFPDDIEAKAFLALEIWLAYGWGSGLPIVSHVAVDALLDQVFAKAPLHPAHHYRIHLWDQEDGKRALDSAAKDGSAAPGIAHLWHMSGHIYDKLHRHCEAAWQQMASARVDHAYMQRDHVMPFLIHNYGHNQEWLARSLSWTGQPLDALAIVKNLAAEPRHPHWNDAAKDDSIAGYARTRLVQICEDHDLYEEGLQLVRDGWLPHGDGVQGEVVRLTLQGRALFRLGRSDAAEQVVAEARELLARARAERATAIDTAEEQALAAPATRPKVLEAVAEAGRRPTDDVHRVLDLLRELDGERLLAGGDAKGAVAVFETIPDLPKVLLADALLAAGEPKRAVELLEPEVRDRPHRVPTAGRLLLAYRALDQASGTPDHREQVAELMLEMPTVGDRSYPQTPLVDRLGIGADIREAPRPHVALEVDVAGLDFGSRPELASLGPALWQPWNAPDFDLPCTDGSRRSLQGQHGRPTLVVFYLGLGCLHCVQQLEALAPLAKDYAAAGIDVLAIGNTPLAKARDDLAALGDQRLPFPLLADSELGAFRAFHCFDDFEQVPLHGTFLLDGDGRVRWQDLGAEPFTKVEWLLAECRRLLALPTDPATVDAIAHPIR